MPLEDLNREIYERDSEVQKRTHETSSFEPTVMHPDGQALREEKKWKLFGGISPELKEKIRKTFTIGLIVVAVVALIGFIIVKVNRSGFADDKVTVEIQGPESVNSNQLATYKIVCRNKNKTALKNAEIVLNYSENFRPETSAILSVIDPSNSRIAVGDVKANAQAEVELAGKFYAPQDFVVYLNATLQYQPASASTNFQTKSQFGVTVKSSPLSIAITAPLEAVDGDTIEYLIEYSNFGTRSFDDIRLKLEYPQGFQVISTDPAGSEGSSVWYIGTLDLSGGGKVKVRGKITGGVEEGKVIKAVLVGGNSIVYGQAEETTRMTSSPLVITQEVNGLKTTNVSAGDELNYRVHYKNAGATEARNVIITVAIDSRVLDYTQLRLKSGAYNSNNKEITWKASDIKELENLTPGEEGIIAFSVPVLGGIPVENQNDKDFTITTVATITSGDIPAQSGSAKLISSSRLELKLNSRVVLETMGYYNDSVLKNSGPIPPQVGKETSYTIHWRIVNVSNDISNVQVVSSLPSGVKWVEKMKPDSENVEFNKESNQLVWNVGKIDSGTGIINSKRELSFQVSITPQVNQIGQTVKLLNRSTLTAKDLFTQEDIKVETKEKNTQLPEDPTLSTKYNVVNSS